MKEIFKNVISDIKVSKKNLFLIVAVAVLVLLLFFSELSGGDTKKEVADENTTVYADEYIKETEKKLEEVLSDVSGAGKVKVMITLESCYENVYAKGYTSKTQVGENENDKEMAEEYIIVKQGSNNEECLVVKVYEPRVKGVAVIAQGADNINVKNAITETICALFDISSASVSVEKMVETK